ncbi:MAG: ribonuclease H family protein [Sebaldella sp.]|nr:ribonuclease H family protein [Sebaldella sp.]
MAKKYYAYYLVDGGKMGISDSWDECSEIVKGVKAKYKSFKSQKEAQEWLDLGANYEIKTTNKKELDKEAIYFDAGTGRGIGVEVRVTDYSGNSLLHKILSEEKISEHGNYVLKTGRTNNFGELVGVYAALRYALANEIKKIYGDSKLIIDFWSKGRYNKDNLESDTVELIKKVTVLRKEFEKSNGKIEYISGDYNPADLGFHK